MSDFDLNVLKRVRFRDKIVYFKISPKSTTNIFHNVLVHKTMYNYSLQYIRQLDNSIRHRLNNTSGTHFRKEFEF